MGPRTSIYAIAATAMIALSGCDGDDGDDGAPGPAGPEGPPGSSGVTSVSLELLGRYESGIFDEGASEIVSYDADTLQIFQVNANSGRVDVLDISSPANPTLVGSIDVAAEVAANSTITTVLGGVNSVYVENGVLAVAIEADAGDERGAAVFFQTSDQSFLAAYEVGFLPDSIALSPDGNTAVVANEGEPLDDYSVDPVGSISVIDISGGVAAATVTDLGFEDFNDGGPRAGELDPTIRIFGVKSDGTPSSVAEDIEPEYVAISPDSSTAYVSLQENNGVAVVDLTTLAIETIWPLGYKDHSLLGNELDPSDRDGGVNIQNWPLLGLLLPDTIAAYDFQGQTLIVTANEGDTRDYDGFSEEARIGDLTLDPVAFPDAAFLQADENLGRLLTTVTQGDDDGDGDYDRLFSIGGRSFSIYTADGRRLYDSGSSIELVTANRGGVSFNADNDDNEPDTRSDAKGPETEAIAVAEIDGATFVFTGNERVGGIVVYNISNPESPRFVTFRIDRDFTEDPSLGDTNGDGIDESNPAAGDLGPESIIVISADDSPDGTPLLVVGNEVSGTTTIYRLSTFSE
jgi:hypothetical protein